MNNSHTQRRRSIAPTLRTGFTLVELIVVIVIIGILAAVIGPRLIGKVGFAKQGTAQANAAAIANAVKEYYADYGAFPEGNNLSLLVARPSSPGGKGPYLENAEMLKDPWGRPFKLLVPPQKNFDFDIVSYGADGNPGGTGEDADVIKP